MSDDTMTATRALGEALEAIFGSDEENWREFLKRVNEERADDSIIINDVASLGFLRRWSAPLLAKEVGE